MVTTKGSLVALVLLLLFGHAASRPMHRGDETLGRDNNDMGAGLAKGVSSSLSLNGDDAWTTSNLLSKRETASALAQGVGRQHEDVSVGFDTDGLGQALTGFLNSVLRLVTFRWN